jgi:hypothetical protein
VQRAQTVNVWPSVAPGSERWTQKELTIPNTPVGTVIFNVVTPTLTAYLPERSKATGHGFGLTKQGTTSDHWIDDFYNWLDAQGLTKPR